MNEVTKVLLERGITKPRCSHDYSSPNKTCSTCKKEYPRTNEYFRKEKKSKDGLSYLCKACASLSCSKSHQKNILARKLFQKSPGFVFSQLKYQAKKRNMPFEITLDHYLERLADKKCHYCGTSDTGHWVNRYINDPTIGYTIDNTVPCCEMCNKMKGHRSPDDFLAHCSKVHKHSKHL